MSPFTITSEREQYENRIKALEKILDDPDNDLDQLVKENEKLENELETLQQRLTEIVKGRIDYLGYIALVYLARSLE